MPATPYQCSRYRQRMKDRAAQAVGMVCCLCGTDRDLEFAHVAPTELNGKGRGLYYRMRDVIRNPLCYRRMCRICHARYDGRNAEADEIS